MVAGLYDAGSGVVPLVYNEVANLWGPIVNPAQTTLLLHRRDLTQAAWSKTNCTAAFTQTGLLGFANTASLLTATSANATCLQAITAASAAHRAAFWIKRLAGSGPVDVTIDGGSTWTRVIPRADRWLRYSPAAQTVENPSAGFRIVTSGDQIIVGNADLVAGSWVIYPAVSLADGGTTAAHAARNLLKTLASPPTSIDISIYFRGPFPRNYPYVFMMSNGASSADALDAFFSGATLIVRAGNSGTAYNTSLSTTTTAKEGVDYRLDVQWSASAFRTRLNSGSWVTAGGNSAVPTLSRLAIGVTSHIPTEQLGAPVWAFRDNIGGLFGEGQGINPDFFA